MRFLLTTPKQENYSDKPGSTHGMHYILPKLHLPCSPPYLASCVVILGLARPKGIHINPESNIKLELGLTFANQPVLKGPAFQWHRSHIRR